MAKPYSKCLLSTPNLNDEDRTTIERYKADGLSYVDAVKEVIDDVLAERSELVAQINIESGGSFDVAEYGAKSANDVVISNQNQEKIEDFGEVLEGAKKHTYKLLSKALEEDVDVSAVPLSKSFPLPNYEKMIADGVDPSVVTAIAQLRAEIKPKRRKQVSQSWIESVDTARLRTKALLKGLLKPEDVYKISPVDAKNELTKMGNDILPEQIKALAEYDVIRHHFSLFKGEENVWKWSAGKVGSSTMFSGEAYFDTKKEALNYVKARVADVNTKTGKVQTKLDIWSERGKKGIFLGKKVASRKYIELKHFNTQKEATEYRDSHYDELIELLAKKKKLRAVRRIDNNPRVGVDYRGGKDVTPELFTETFGFRGVQFGKWVNNSKRHEDLNNAFDGLMDLAGLIGVPPKALSLNGTLGLAFGARGRGGKDPAAAHYESSNVNINLTKMNGSGSLAHEVFHAIDDYFGKMETNGGFISESGRSKRKTVRVDNYNKMVETTDADFNVRKEVYDAWKNLSKMLREETKLVDRSVERDNVKGKDYWSTVKEMTARSFERYVINKLEAEGYSSDYLANIVSEKDHNTINEALGQDEAYAYPLDSEMDAVNAAYDKLFETIETKETESGTAMYSRKETEAERPANPKSKDQTEAVKLNNALANHLGEQWRNSYEQTDMRSSGTDFKEAVQAAFGTRVVTVRPTAERFNEFNGIYVPSNRKTVYINTKANVGFVNVVGHELLHDLKRTRPDLYSYLLDNARQHFKNLKGYRAELDNLLQEGEAKHTDAVIEEELIADFMGDAMADPAFLEQLAKDNPSKFKRLLTAVTMWLAKVKNKLKGLGSNQYLNDVEAMRKYLRSVLNAYAKGGNISEAMDSIEAPLFSVAWHGSPFDHNKFDSSKIGTGEGAQAYGYGHYMAGKRAVAEWYRDKLGIKEIMVDGKPLTYQEGAVANKLRIVLRNVESGRMSLNEAIEDAAADLEISKNPSDTADAKELRKLSNSKITEQVSGNLYQVDLTPKESEYLLWDESIENQSDMVQKAIRPLLEDAWQKKGKKNERGFKSKEEFLEALLRSGDDVQTFAKVLTGGNKNASNYLSSVGIRGIKYLNGDSRNSDKGGYNYVIFSDEDITITHKNDVMFSRKTGNNTAWKDEKGFEGMSQESLDAAAHINTPPNAPLGDTVKAKYEELKDRAVTKLRQGILDQFDSINSVLKDKRSWMLTQMSGAAGGAVEMTISGGSPFLHKSGVIQIDTSKKSLAEIFEPLGNESQRFLMWIAGNRANAIHKRSKAAQEAVKTLNKDIKKLKAYVNGGADTSNINVDGTRSDLHNLPDLNESRKELKVKEFELKMQEKIASVDERLLSEVNMAELMAFNKNDNGTKWAEREATYESVRKEFEALHASVVQIGVDSGLVSKSDAKVWKEQGFYVPFYRLADEDKNAKYGVPSASGMVGQTAYKKMKGADMQLNDLLLNTVMNWEHIISGSLKNQAARSALKTAVEMGIASEATQVEHGKNAVFIREDGKQLWYDIDDTTDGRLVLESLTSLNYSGLNNPAMKTLRKFKRILTISVTASPQFKIANLIRDTLQAIAVGDMDTNFLKNVHEGMKLTRDMSEEMIQATAAGGLFGDSGYISGSDPEAIKISLAKGVAQSEILDSEHKLKKWWNKYQDAGARLENVNRISNIDQNIKKGQDLLTANFAGRDHLDFQRSGAFVAVRVLTQSIPFLNARLQGLDKMGRAFADPKQRKQLLTVMGTYAAASVLLYLYMKDDDDYKEAEEWERDTYHLIKLPNSDVMVRIPRPFELGALVNLFERGVEQFVDPDVDGKVFFERLSHALTETFAMSIIPQAFKPVMEVRENKSSFTGRQIESQSAKRLSPTNRRKPWTSKTAVGLSVAMDSVLPDGAAYSPIQIDHLINGYFGWMGSVFVQGVDILARPLTGEGSKPAMRIQDYPVIGRFVREAKGSNAKQITQLYDRSHELNTLFADINLYKANKEMDKYKDALKEGRKDLRYRKAYSKAALRLGKYSTMIKNILKDKKMNSSTKRIKITKINNKRVELARRIVEKYPLS